MRVLQFCMHLISKFSGLSKTDAVTIQVLMMKFYDNAKGIPQYINMLEEG